MSINIEAPHEKSQERFPVWKYFHESPYGQSTDLLHAYNPTVKNIKQKMLPNPTMLPSYLLKR